ncbi:MAG TPA: hypothetical protein PKX07_13110 [Aggregatilineales bacterium]|nr:hypothetical protein [Aggregatilineales bacterium]
MDGERVYIALTAPEDSVEAILDAIAAAGGGIIGEYTHCAFTCRGTGYFKPSADANPHVGARQALNAVDEIRIETFAPRERASAVVQAIRAAHPYEEPVIYVLPLLAV